MAANKGATLNYYEEEQEAGMLFHSTRSGSLWRVVWTACIIQEWIIKNTEKIRVSVIPYKSS